jgi:hypothetical protein
MGTRCRFFSLAILEPIIYTLHMPTDETLCTPEEILEAGRERRAREQRLRAAISAIDKKNHGSILEITTRVLLLGFLTVLGYMQIDWDTVLTHRTALSIMGFFAIWIWTIHSFFSQFNPDPVELAIRDLLEDEQNKRTPSE